MSARPFLDTNVLVYLLSSDAAKADRAEGLLAARAVVSVQVLNEFSNVATRKLGLDWAEVGEVLVAVRAACQVEPLTLEVHDLAREFAPRYRIGFYDALILASARLAECRVVYSEDLHDGLKVDRVLTVRNPFKGMRHPVRANA